MTDEKLKGHDSPDRLSLPEIEVTEEMLEAGYDACFDVPQFPTCGREGTFKALTLAFRAMLEVHFRGRPGGYDA